MIYYKQCAIQKDNETILIWIPERFAVKEKLLKMKLSKNWQSGWEVIRVFSVRLDDVEILDSAEKFIGRKNIREMKNK